jgi:cytochrome c553
MKKISIIIVISLVIAQCTTQKRIEYVIPGEYTGQTRVNMEKMLQQGQTLFKIYCSPCHGIFTKGKDSIPNFSTTQIEAYKTAALLDDPKNHAVAQRVRPEDLDMILQFLSFRKPPKP